MRTTELVLCLVMVALLGYLVGREHARHVWMAAYARLTERYMRLLRVTLHRTPPGSRQEPP